MGVYVGLGIPIPVLDRETVRSTAIRDEDIMVDIIDYGVPVRSRPSLRKVSYAELKSGVVELQGEEVRTSSLSSHRRAREIALTVRSWVEEGKLVPALPTRTIDSRKSVLPLRETVQGPRVLDIMDRRVISIGQDEEIRAAARDAIRMINQREQRRNQDMAKVIPFHAPDKVQEILEEDEGMRGAPAANRHHSPPVIARKPGPFARDPGCALRRWHERSE